MTFHIFIVSVGQLPKVFSPEPGKSIYIKCLKFISAWNKLTDANGLVRNKIVTSLVLMHPDKVGPNHQ